MSSQQALGWDGNEEDNEDGGPFHRRRRLQAADGAEAVGEPRAAEAAHASTALCPMNSQQAVEWQDSHGGPANDNGMGDEPGAPLPPPASPEPSAGVRRRLRRETRPLTVCACPLGGHGAQGGRPAAAA